VPQAPQLLASELVSTQVPEQQVPEQQSWPSEQVFPFERQDAHMFVTQTPAPLLRAWR
jgi:hypothetical protein